MSGGSFLTGDRLRDQRNVDLLLAAVTELYASDDLDALMQRAVDRAIAVTGAERGALLLADADGELRVRLARDREGRDVAPLALRYSGTVARKVWTTGRPHLTVDMEGSGSALSPSLSIISNRILSVLAVPLLVGERRIGVLYVHSTKAAKEFTEGDRAVFEVLAGTVSLALERARLAAEEAHRKRLQREMDAARQIQQSLVPRDLGVPAGFEVAAMTRPCVETSGDYHDVLRLEDGTVALVVGDVSGHGLAPALHMTSARAVVRTRLRRAEDLAGALAALNDFLCADLQPGAFMTLFAGVLDAARRHLHWASAGHNAPLHWRAGRGVEELLPTGPLLGVMPGAAYRVRGPVTLEPTDAVLLFTDGLSEGLEATSREVWGDERLAEAFARHAARAPDAQGVLAGVCADHAAWVGAAEASDDVTALVLRARSAGPA